MNIYIREKVAENAAKVGRHILERLEAEFKPLPCVGSFTGLGLMIGLEIVADKASKSIPDPTVLNRWRIQVLEKGLYFRAPAGAYHNQIFICPPCITTVEEADRILDILLPTVAAIKPTNA
jgi:4-aminobutyrate aminotransferase-like enzyme